MAMDEFAAEHPQAMLEVLDATGSPVPRARLRAIWETTIDLRSRGSLDPGLRVLWGGGGV